MMVNFKGQLDFKVKRGAADATYDKVVQELNREIHKVAMKVLEKNDPQGLYSFIISEGKSVMR